ncbi:MAG: hypothetical protein Kow0074_01680 [Candidatus Zixiibacteriota bacterium]
MSLSDTSRLVLERADLFNGLSHDDLEAINGYLEQTSMPDGGVLFEEGQRCDRLYVVRRGQVKILKNIAGSMVELARRGPGEMVGEMALTGSSDQIVTALCEPGTDLFVLPQTRFQEILAEHPRIAARILTVLATRLNETHSAHLYNLEIKNRDLEFARTRLEQLLQQLRKSNDHLEAALAYRDRVLAVSPYPAIITDVSNNIRLINPAAMHLFGQTMSNQLWAWLTPTNPSDLDEIESTLARGSMWKGEIEVLNEHHHPLICKLVAAPIVDQGDGDSTRLWMFEDLTEMRFLEQQALQREQLAIKGEMAAEIAHDLNNYLAVLSGNAELMSMQLSDEMPDSMRKRVANMIASIERIRVFTDNLLNSRHPSGERISINLNDFLDNQIAFLKPQKRIKKVNVETSWDPDLPDLECDPGAIQQIFYNLMLNAADSLAEAGVDRTSVFVKTSYNKSSNSITLSVADNGPGIPSHLLGSMFKERVSSKPTGHGFGLLTIARLVEEHGGSVGAMNRPEGGAEFTVVLPVTRGDKDSR